MKTIKYYTLDVFTETKYGGNQLAVFPDATSIKPNLFQQIARELNLSETVFLFPPKGEASHTMRIFTPGTELPTAGHPTIGTAYYLAQNSDHEVNKVSLHQKVGQIEVDVTYRNGKPDMCTMFQPLPEFGPLHNDMLPDLAALLSLEIGDFENLPIQEISCGNNTLLLPLRSTEALGRAKIRMDVWERIRQKFNRPLLYVFTKNGVQNADVQGRMFGPEVGIGEDPATGSANGPLVCYLLRHKILSPPLLSLQGYEMGRPSQLYLDADADDQGNIRTVKVGGKCVFTGEGKLYMDSE